MPNLFPISSKVMLVSCVVVVVVVVKSGILIKGIGILIQFDGKTAVAASAKAVLFNQDFHYEFGGNLERRLFFWLQVDSFFPDKTPPVLTLTN